MGIDAIKTAITRKLYFSFGERYEIYTEQVPQGFKEPCFFVQFLNLEKMNRLGDGNFRITTLFNIQYFGPGADIKALEVQLALDTVELLTGQLMLAASPNSEVVDGIAHNFMNFNFNLRAVHEKDFMDSIELATRKGG